MCSWVLKDILVKTKWINSLTNSQIWVFSFWRPVWKCNLGFKRTKLVEYLIKREFNTAKTKFVVV